MLQEYMIIIIDDDINSYNSNSITIKDILSATLYPSIVYNCMDKHTDNIL